MLCATNVLSVQQSLWLAGGLIATASLALVGVIVWQAYSWLPQIGPGEPTYFFQRVLYVLARMIDVPILQVLIVGFVLLFYLRWKCSFSRPA